MSDTSKAYPRALPFKAPEEMRQREAALRRWGYMLLISTFAAVAFVLGAGFFMLKQMDRYKAAAGERQAVGDKKDPGANPSPSEKNDKAISVPPTVPLQRSPFDPPAATDPPKAGETQRDRFLDALGKLTVIHLYQSYLSIGLLADCTESEVYMPDEAEKWLERVVAQLQLVDEQLEVLAKHDLDAEEKKDVERCRLASQKLRTQSTELREYWKNSDKDHAARYHKAREDAWTSISEILAIPKDQ